MWNYRQVSFKASQEAYKSARAEFENHDALPRRGMETDRMDLLLGENEFGHYVAVFDVEGKNERDYVFSARIFSTDVSVAERSVDKLRKILEARSIEVTR